MEDYEKELSDRETEHKKRIQESYNYEIRNHINTMIKNLLSNNGMDIKSKNVRNFIDNFIKDFLCNKGMDLDFLQ